MVLFQYSRQIILQKMPKHYFKFEREEDPGALRETRWIFKCPGCGAQKVECKSVNIGFGSAMSKADFETYHCTTEDKTDIVKKLMSEGKSPGEIREYLELLGMK